MKKGFEVQEGFFGQRIKPSIGNGSVKIFAHICGWAPRRFQIASAMVSA